MAHTAGPSGETPLASPLAGDDVPLSASWLRRHTRDDHRAAEAGLDLRRLQRPADLVGLLRGWRTVWRAVSVAAAAAGAVHEARAELLPSAAQSVTWLQADLEDLALLTEDRLVPGHDRRAVRGRTQELRTARALASMLASPASTWGVAYVLRGSRLGGSVLAPQVRSALHLPPSCATAFLESRGTDPGRDWVALRRRLDAQQLGQADRDAAGAAARWTFSWVGAVMAESPCAGTAQQRRGLPDVATGVAS